MLAQRHNNEIEYELGVDESGRGTLFGSVFVAAVMFPKDIEVPKDIPLNDSKKLTPMRRAKVREWIEKNALQYHVTSRDSDYIDKHDIWQATLSGMNECIEILSQDKSPEHVHVVIDGNRFVPKSIDIQYTTVEKADAKYIHVAAASILAKEYHDDHIRDLVKEDPTLTRYKIDGNMGYGTPTHIAAIKEHGPSRWHRKSFNPCKGMVSSTQTPETKIAAKKRDKDVIIRLRKQLATKEKEYQEKYGESPDDKPEQV